MASLTAVRCHPDSGAMRAAIPRMRRMLAMLLPTTLSSSHVRRADQGGVEADQEFRGRGSETD
jgi:hypothetical protein